MTAEPLLGGALDGTWIRPESFQVNRLPMRPPLVPCPDVVTARREREDSPWFRSLDGTWRFRLYPRPPAVPTDAVDPATDDAGWDQVEVPGCWTRQGFDRPHYTNIQMPFPGEPPEVPAANPTGVYRTRFSLPPGWARRRTVLSIGGAESVAYVWCNGSFVGMSKDSRLAAELDLSGVVRARGNCLAVVVVRWSDATWIEDQDHWFHAGLHREVTLTSTDTTWLADVAATAGLEGADRGTLEVEVRTRSTNPVPAGWEIRARVETGRGRSLGRPLVGEITPSRKGSALDRLAARADGPATCLTASFDGIEPWTHETPARYRLLVELVDPGGTVREAVGAWVGFRRVEVRDRRLLLNGEPVLIHGVNRHDHHPDTGKVQTEDDLRADLVAMKRFGFNAVRTAHYPNDPRLVELCDELGLWVVAEANVESHARQDSLTHDPRWAAAIIDRVSRLVVRDRSHPSVMGWSLGNESGYAPVHDAAAAWVRHTDPSRFVHYEGAIFTGAAGGGTADSPDVTDHDRGVMATDVVCPMYPSLDQLVAWAGCGDRRPLIMCEYSHAMGNANGSLSDYWDLIEATDGLQGGFVWDWKDQGLRETTAEGREFFAYGGHFGDEPNDVNFCCNGLVGPDGDPHPAVREHAKLAEVVRLEPVDARRGRFRLHNRQWFTDVGWLRARWTVLVGGDPVDGGELDLPDVGPGATAVVDIPFERTALPQGRESHLDVSFSSRRTTPWLARGEEVAWSQHQLRATGRRAPARSTTPPDVEVDVDVDGDGRLRLGDLRLSAVEACLWRAPIDNDGLKQGVGGELSVGARGRWLRLGLDRLTVDDLTVRRRGARWTIRRRLGDHVRHDQTITVGPGGVEVSERVSTPATWHDLARVGVRFVAPAGLEQLRWYGLGPHDTYPDRRRSGRVAIWSSTVSEQYVPFVVPQHHGSHLDTRWFELTDDVGSGFRVEAPRPLTFSALHHSVEALTGALTLADVDADDVVHVHVDAAMRGLGNAACGPEVLPRYRVPGGTHEWTWRLTSLAGRRPRSTV